MPQYVIEREIPNVGQLTESDLHGVSTKSNDVLRSMTQSGKDVKWLHSYVTGDKIYCVYDASSADTVREHARLGGFPANSVEEVKSIISPASGD